MSDDRDRPRAGWTRGETLTVCAVLGVATLVASAALLVRPVAAGPPPPPTEAAQRADAASSTGSAALPSRVTVPISGRDRVYTADQTSNTVTVIDPAANRVLGTIALGAQRLSNLLHPQYLNDIDVHGLMYAPGRQRLAVVSVGSKRVISTLAVGQEPQALVYVPDAAPRGDAPGLGTQGLGEQGHDLPTTLPGGIPGQTLDPVRGETLEATVRTVAGVDMLDLQARNLRPSTTYEALQVDALGTRTRLVSFTTDAKGAAPYVLAFTVLSARSIALQVAA